jgi:hypothetical protein
MILNFVHPKTKETWLHSTRQLFKKFLTLWRQKEHCRVHNILSVGPTLSQLNPFQTLTLHFSKIHVNIILSLTVGSPKRSLPLKFSHWNCVCISHFPLRVTGSAYLILLGLFIPIIILCEGYGLLISYLCNFPPPTINILLSTLFPNSGICILPFGWET